MPSCCRLLQGSAPAALPFPLRPPPFLLPFSIQHRHAHTAGFPFPPGDAPVSAPTAAGPGTAVRQHEHPWPAAWNAHCYSSCGNRWRLGQGCICLLVCPRTRVRTFTERCLPLSQTGNGQGAGRRGPRAHFIFARPQTPCVLRTGVLGDPAAGKSVEPTLQLLFLAPCLCVSGYLRHLRLCVVSTVNVVVTVISWAPVTNA